MEAAEIWKYVSDEDRKKIADAFVKKMLKGINDFDPDYRIECLFEGVCNWILENIDAKCFVKPLEKGVENLFENAIEALYQKKG